MLRERFAPSPTGLLHLGHAYSALKIWDAVCRSDGEFILRIEDIDFSRSRREFECAIFEDLKWLGIRWREPVIRQSDQMQAYSDALETLQSLGVCFPCKCTRRDIREALAAPQEGTGNAVGIASESDVYPGTCRDRPMHDMADGDSIRLDIAKAIFLLGGPRQVNKISFLETGGTYRGRHNLETIEIVHRIGDIVLARKDIGTSYHLSVVVDDAAQGITRVTRGEDLFEATAIHRILQELLGFTVPAWHHHRLIRDEFGKRLAKRDDARSIRAFREAGVAPQDIRRLVGL